MEQTGRIAFMENCLDEGTAAVRGLEAALDRYQEARRAIRAVSAYYGSEEWRRDFEDDEAGKLPADLRRGILTEDAAYNLLTEDRELLVRMLETAAAALRDK
ncbi:MAG: DUF4298 domain-containing protein [Fretibacterium sp.]|nr:DUF4298 domain-containing protein [Fretibacterium sp.]